MADFWDLVKTGGETAPGTATAPGLAGAPKRSSSQGDVDAWNSSLRASPMWQDYMKSIGVNLADARPTIKLTDQQRKEFTNKLAAAGMPVPSGMHIDAAGNLNQDNHLLRNVGIGAGIAGAALTGFGLAGMGPMSGLFAGAGAGAGGALPSSHLAAAALMGGPAGITSGGASLGAVAGLGATGAGLGLGGPAGFGALSGPMAAENTMFGAPQMASVLTPAAHGIATGVSPELSSIASHGGIGSTIRNALTNKNVMQQVFGAGMDLYGAKRASDSANKAAAIQALWAQKALDFENKKYDTATANYAPYIAAGKTSLSNLSDILATPRTYGDDMLRLARGGRA